MGPGVMERKATLIVFALLGTITGCQVVVPSSQNGESICVGPSPQLAQRLAGMPEFVNYRARPEAMHNPAPKFHPVPTRPVFSTSMQAVSKTAAAAASGGTNNLRKSSDESVLPPPGMQTDSQHAPGGDADEESRSATAPAEVEFRSMRRAGDTVPRSRRADIRILPSQPIGDGGQIGLN
jgi:hypothetical protein